MSRNSLKRSAVIVDIDGVLACNEDRLVHVHQDRNNPDWDAFYENIENDPLLHEWHRVLKMFSFAGVHIILVSNRPHWLREKTEQWLKAHRVPHNELRLRPEGEVYENAKKVHLAEIKEEHHVYLAVDDDPEHVRMYEEAGVPTIYVHSGYYDGGRVPDDKIIK